MIHVISDCTLEDAVTYLKTREVGSWAAVNDGTKYDTFVIKTSDDEVTVHDKIKFGVDKKHGMFMTLNGVHYLWDDFWKKMINIYNLNLDRMFIIDEEDDFIPGVGETLESLGRKFVDDNLSSR